MDAIYPYVLVVHLLCAIIFIQLARKTPSFRAEM